MFANRTRYQKYMKISFYSLKRQYTFIGLKMSFLVSFDNLHHKTFGFCVILSEIRGRFTSFSKHNVTYGITELISLCEISICKVHLKEHLRIKTDKNSKNVKDMFNLNVSNSRKEHVHILQTRL